MDSQDELHHALATAEQFWAVAIILLIFILGPDVTQRGDIFPRYYIKSTRWPGMVTVLFGPVLASIIIYLWLRFRFTYSELLPGCRPLEYSASVVGLSPVAWACNLERLSQWAAIVAKEGITAQSLLSLWKMAFVQDVVAGVGFVAFTTWLKIYYPYHLHKLNTRESDHGDDKTSTSPADSGPRDGESLV
ncbi:hypothetical protein CB0940_09596 [Cercospora beticola]|uniref:Uncharacterized protein n=1 Tax=Cercospora beticola TaxID=122368 RepID=A0A2G5HHT3_CERBT|nr:hypothetical protein CB0940_09596 [Cercospora beticola]PIA92146.1 hypothetical protein CB0940_09596 [Cercospora beticola]WPB06071.1 hypothetical protein RHO25_010728 [Cercospora beticola]